jgi:site-specific DNA-methyltransferase (adenine-specific)
VELEKNLNKIIHGDALKVLKSEIPDESVDCCITSPPYWNLRDYGVSGQLGREKQPREYIDKLIEIFEEVKRVLKKTGSCWIVLSDTYDKDKDLVGIPEMFRLGMKDKGWTLRNKIIWKKRNATPQSAKDRFTIDYEYVFFFVKSPKNKPYFKTQYEPHNPKYAYRYKTRFGSSTHKSGQGAFDFTKERFLKPNPKGRIKRCVWDIPVMTYRGAHFAVYPTKLLETPIHATCPEDGIVLDPFMGSGTTALVALQNNRKFIGIELNENNIELAYKRLKPLLYQEKLAIIS